MLTGGAKLEAYLKDLSKKVSQRNTLRVGFLEGVTYPAADGGQSVAMVAAIMNFGAPARGIPPRPFFSNMIASKSGEWGPALGAQLKANGYDGRVALELLGKGIEGQLVQSIHDTNTPPLSPKTIKAKGFAKPLIHSSLMWKSVNSEVV